MTYIEVRDVMMPKTSFLMTFNYYSNWLPSSRRKVNKIWQSFWPFIQFRFQNGHFVPCSISGVVTTGKIRKLSKPAKLQWIVYERLSILINNCDCNFAGLDNFLIFLVLTSPEIEQGTKWPF